MNNWDRAEEYSQRAESSQWLKLVNDGDKAVVKFAGEPHPREVVFDEGKYQPFTKEHEAKGLKASFRFPINVVLLPALEVKVFEIGQGLMRDVLKVRQKYGLDTWAFEIARSGGPKDPKTSYSILPERQLTDEERRRCAQLKLHDLVELYEGRGASTPPANDDAAPIDDAIADELVEQLRPLPRATVDEWLYELRISRVRELTVGKLAEARELLKRLVEHGKRTAADPFD